MTTIAMTTFKDRTNEFHSLCERKRLRNTTTTTNVLERKALLSASPEPKQPKKTQPRSEFSMMAAEISKQITNTAGKLEKLTKCNKKNDNKERKELTCLK